MKEVYIKIDTVDKVKTFCEKLRKIDGDFDLQYGNMRIDAKSFLGILTMDLSQPVKMLIHEDENLEKLGEMQEYFAEK